MASIQHQKGRPSPYRVFWRDDKTGKKRNKSFSRRKDALAFIETIRIPGNSIDQISSDLDIAKAMEHWLQQAKTTGLYGREQVESSTRRQYASHCAIISSREGATKLDKLDELECGKLRDRLLGEYSRPYAKKIFTSFKSAMKFATKQGFMAQNPAADVNILISKRQRNASRISIPDLSEVYELTQAIERLMKSKNKNIAKAWLRYGPLFQTMLYTGMRPSEIRGFMWSNIDWQRCGVNVTQRADEYCKIGPLKSGAAMRFIPLPSDVMERLKVWRGNCPHGKYDLVFPSWKGSIENHANITNRGWYPLCEEAGLTEKTDGKIKAKYPLYALRHVKASLEIELGRSPKRIQQIMGHEDIRMTFDVYGHLFQDQSAHEDADAAFNLIQRVAKELPEKN